MASCIFCDDIRYEVGNKVSLIGIYGGDIIFPFPPPTLITKFGIAVQLIADLDDVPEKVTISITIPPEQQEILKLELPTPELTHPTGATKAHMRALLPLQPFPLTDEGFIEVMVDTPGRDPIRAGRLFVKFAPPVDTPAEDDASAAEENPADP